MAAQPKHARQILLKVIDLCKDPYPPDSKQLRGTNRDFRRADAGEYRIVFLVEGEELIVPLIGKRNDDEVYKEMKRRGL